MPKAPAKPRGPHQTLIQRSREVAPIEKAEFTVVTGRVIRDFMGLTQADEDAVVARLQLFLDEQAA